MTKILLRHPRFWLCLGFVWTLVVIYFCLAPISQPDMGIRWFDKLEHVAAFAGLAGWFGASLRRRYLWIGIGLSLLGLAIEVLQGFTGRDPSLWDWVADSGGVLLGLLLAQPLGVPVIRYFEGRVARA